MAIKTRTKQKETMNIGIKDVDVEIEDIILVKTIAQILVRFTSDQVVTTTDTRLRASNVPYRSGRVPNLCNELSSKLEGCIIFLYYRKAVRY